ncbi:MAG: type II toxin-antitoxin system mRNA interferase toxin, RelE/StbE family [bacterium]|nr:type II toxin-antitoxin system mRNA interferase toxin, RelE/StbE family [bacterium]
MLYEIRFTKEALKDFNKLSPKLQNKLKEILRHKIAVEPYSGKKLVGDLKGLYSLRLSYKDRVVYAIDEELHVVTLLKTRTHYGE